MYIIHRKKIHGRIYLDMDDQLKNQKEKTVQRWVKCTKCDCARVKINCTLYNTDLHEKKIQGIKNLLEKKPSAKCAECDCGRKRNKERQQRSLPPPYLSHHLHVCLQNNHFRSFLYIVANNPFFHQWSEMWGKDALESGIFSKAQAPTKANWALLLLPKILHLF